MAKIAVLGLIRVSQENEIFLCNFGQIFHYFKQFRGIFEVGNSIFCSSLVVGGTPHLDLDRCQSRSRLVI